MKSSKPKPQHKPEKFKFAIVQWFYDAELAPIFGHDPDQRFLVPLMLGFGDADRHAEHCEVLGFNSYQEAQRMVDNLVKNFPDKNNHQHNPKVVPFLQAQQLGDAFNVAYFDALQKKLEAKRQGVKVLVSLRRKEKGSFINPEEYKPDNRERG